MSRNKPHTSNETYSAATNPTLAASHYTPELCGETLRLKTGEARESKCLNRATHEGRCAMHAPSLRAARYATREAKRLEALRTAPPSLQERLVAANARIVALEAERDEARRRAEMERDARYPWDARIMVGGDCLANFRERHAMPWEADGAAVAAARAALAKVDGEPTP